MTAFSGLAAGGAGADRHGDGGAERGHVHLPVADRHRAWLDPLPPLAGRVHHGHGPRPLLPHQAPAPLRPPLHRPPQERVDRNV